MTFLGFKAQGKIKPNRTEMTLLHLNGGGRLRGLPRKREVWTVYSMAIHQLGLCTEASSCRLSRGLTLGLAHCLCCDHVRGMYLWSTNHVLGSLPGAGDSWGKNGPCLHGNCGLVGNTGERGKYTNQRVLTVKKINRVLWDGGENNHLSKRDGSAQLERKRR